MLARHVRDSEVVVPPGHYFALGDNRDQSSDSRYWGFVPRENVVGTPLFIYWSYDAPTDRLLNPSFGHVLDLALNFFTKTRWERTFQRPKSYRIE
jgi:signal peptidase I